MSGHLLVHRRQETGVVDRFMTEKAVSADTARPLVPLSSTQRAAWRRLQRSGVIREAGRGHFYLDRHRLAEVRQLQRVVLITVLGLVVAGVVAQLILSRP